MADVRASFTWATITSSAGHKSFLASIDANNVLDLIRRNQVDVVAFSILSTEVEAFVDLAVQLKASFPELPRFVTLTVTLPRSGSVPDRLMEIISV